MKDGDGILMANVRADRVRQLLAALLDPGFTGFPRLRTVKLAAAAGMTEYSTALNRSSRPSSRRSSSAMCSARSSAAGLKQLRIAETEKYAHVTFFSTAARRLIPARTVSSCHRQRWQPTI
jgi:2,3-bisphosphoglycerate-independent phosphoglycerate mutase